MIFSLVFIVIIVIMTVVLGIVFSEDYKKRGTDDCKFFEKKDNRK